MDKFDNQLKKILYLINSPCVGRFLGVVSDYFPEILGEDLESPLFLQIISVDLGELGLEVLELCGVEVRDGQGHGETDGQTHKQLHLGYPLDRTD